MKNSKNFLRRSVLMGAVAMIGLNFSPLAANADELAEIKERGVLRIAMTGQYPPFNFVNESNEVVGFDPAIGTEIAKRMGLETEIITTAWDGIIGGLIANKYDAVVGSMSITEERDKVIDFVGPYYNTKRAFFTVAGSEITTLEQLDDESVRVGLTLGETHDQWARDQGYNVKTYKGLPELLLELTNGRVDVIVNDSIPVLLAMKAGQYDLAEIPAPDAEAFPAGIAIRENNPELAAAMQKALDDMMEDGTYMEFANEWVGGDIR
ncbi:transporter substrate-binding domain-containing protein [Lentibacter sp. XHP0401]|uniref:transporter substrate-binding domain-containing protein n=1 Tax=Lentibacter sp. XHP0401 TaxID=2984334 RepID=UPI0021E89511|nr:transporter substrate-binding domain-containing protein [Lentibacter sp. XHP0401]MCV2892860.1 transporter substrate-binding domain-containing protein [Lentibacter sp. XHP0401]